MLPQQKPNVQSFRTTASGYITICNSVSCKVTSGQSAGCILNVPVFLAGKENSRGFITVFITTRRIIIPALHPVILSPCQHDNEFPEHETDYQNSNDIE
jgi:hypothetical protein